MGASSKRIHAVENSGRVVQAKFKTKVVVKTIEAMNDRQQEYMESLVQNTITVGRGSAGTGKTYIASVIAANQYLLGEIDQIIVMRPIIGMGKSSGAWPGTIEEKIGPYVMPILNTIKKVIGEDKYKNDFGKNILIQPLESVRGMSFDKKTIVILDEAQNTSPDEIRSIVTRLEEGCKLYICGDDAQKDVSGTSGIVYLDGVIKKHKLPKCGVVNFYPEDIVRSGLTKRFVEIFDKEGAAPK